jgi:hypothetical protein
MRIITIDPCRAYVPAGVVVVVDVATAVLFADDLIDLVMLGLVGVRNGLDALVHLGS